MVDILQDVLQRSPHARIQALILSPLLGRVKLEEGRASHHSSHPSQVALVVKNSLANAGDIRVKGLILGLGRSLGEGHGNPLQYSCLENPMDRGAWQATVCRVAKSRTWLKWLDKHESGKDLQCETCLPTPDIDFDSDRNEVVISSVKWG